MNAYYTRKQISAPQPVPQILLDDDSLIRLKGIDKKRCELLEVEGIDSAFELLQRCITPTSRRALGEKLFKKEKPNCTSNLEAWKDNYAKQVDSWVKQANLLRIKNMDEDTAYLLVQMGIRHEDDLAKVDKEKVYGLLSCMANAQPTFSLVDEKRFEYFVQDATTVPEYYLIGRSRMTTLKQTPSSRLLQELKKQQLKGQVDAKLLQALARELASKQITRNFSSTVVHIGPEFDDPDPDFLFRQDKQALEGAKVIPQGLGYLKDVEEQLPLPNIIEGYVLLIPSRACAGEEAAAPLPNAEVKLTGIFGPNMDKNKKDFGPTSYTDSQGKFILRMPDLYNLQEAITITISQGANKQEFIISATDILKHVDKAKVLNAFQNWYRLCLQEEGMLRKDANAATTQAYKDLLERKEKIAAIIRSSDEEQERDFEIIYKELFTLDNLKADFTAEPFILQEDIFKNKVSRYSSVLPQVKLLESNDQPIYLPTDTAPSQIFNYSMLQRLVEPTISKTSGRGMVEESIDVDDFKSRLATKPQEWPQMSSLGIGYILNMHQAWVPDGFALGNLLYSLILAPGEEQRLVVRENKQTYSLQDTAEGSESVSEDYRNNQLDNTTAAYDYALEQMSLGQSSSKYETKSNSFGGHGGFAGFGAVFGLSGSFSKSSGSASSSASQRNSHNEASNAAQQFQHGIKTASDRISQAQRLSISLATSEQSDSVATRIIANHNHSHAMTIQYWEVMRRYSLETCIEGVDLVLYVPLKLIQFAKGEALKLSELTKEKVMIRYATLNRYTDDLLPALPGKYRTGLRLIQKYLTSPQWILESTNRDSNSLTLSFNAALFAFDRLEAVLYLKNGKGSIAGSPSLVFNSFPANTYETAYDLKEYIRATRVNGKNGCSFTFTLPANASLADLSHIQLTHNYNTFKFALYKNPNATGLDGMNVGEIIERLTGKMYDLAKDRDDSANDRTKIAYFEDMLPEAWVKPIVTLSPYELQGLGIPSLTDVSTNCSNEEVKVSAGASSSSLASPIRIALSTDVEVASVAELQEMEQTYQHVVNNTMTYSQAIWAALTADERALLLEQYSVDMAFEKLDTALGAEQEGQAVEDISIPLLNCIDVKKLLGFYGNCMLFPFTYPQQLAQKIGKTAAELQDSLYRYHANYFRVPTTTISLPTDGMIGEAVLSQTNISEKIDLTRFWNWKDSPIDKMPLDSGYLNGHDYLAGKSTKDISALNLQGVNPTAPVTAADLISALVNKPTPKFDNITGLSNLEQILNKGTDSASTGRDNVLNQSAATTKNITDYAYKLADLYVKYKQNKDKDQTEEAAGTEAGKGTAAGGAGAGKGTAAGGAAGGLTTAMPEIVKAALQAIAKKETVEVFVGKYVNKNFDLDEIKLIYDVANNVVKLNAAAKK